MTRPQCLCVLLLWLTAPGATHAQLVTDLSPETERAFEAYIASIGGALAQKPSADRPLPWTGEDAVAKVRNGQTVIKALSREAPHPIAGGLVHDWAGGIFFPGTNVEQVVSVLQNFARHKEWYPEVIESKLISGSTGKARGTWVLRRKNVITVVLRAELESEVTPIHTSGARLTSKSSPIVEVQNYGEAGQEDFPPKQGHGFLWRFNAYWSLQQVSEGVFAECRIISLSRNVPAGLGLIVNPFIRSMPRESLRSTLEHTRAALKPSR